jgi:plasmid maintenance system antidote protein VapI
VQKKVVDIEQELALRIYKLFISKYNGNKSAFARAINCNETTVRRIFRNEQGITFNLLVRIANALDVEPSELIKDLKIK